MKISYSQMRNEGRKTSRELIRKNTQHQTRIQSQRLRPHQRIEDLIFANAEMKDEKQVESLPDRTYSTKRQYKANDFVLINPNYHQKKSALYEDGLFTPLLARTADCLHST